MLQQEIDQPERSHALLSLHQHLALRPVEPFLTLFSLGARYLHDINIKTIITNNNLQLRKTMQRLGFVLVFPGISYFLFLVIGQLETDISQPTRINEKTLKTLTKNQKNATGNS